MQITFYGVRGSIPSPGRDTVLFGGNTACVYLEIEGVSCILDAGTGIRLLGQQLIQKEPSKLYLFISHTHWDHIQGFPFFLPLYKKGWEIHVYGPQLFHSSIEETLRMQMEYAYFPVRLGEVQAEIHFTSLKEESFLLEGKIQVETLFLNHPVTCLGYKFSYNNKTLFYATDHEPYYDVLGEEESQETAKKMNERYEKFVEGVDIYIADAQFLPEEYPRFRGWGHAPLHYIVNTALKGGVSYLFFTHHDPNRKDRELIRIEKHYRNLIQKKGYSLSLYAAQEGKRFSI